MASLFNTFLAGLVVIALCATAMAAAQRPSDRWTLYRFDGHAFVPGTPADDGTFVALRDGMRPAVLSRSARPGEIPLPAGTGAVAGICYIQSSGGKLAPGPGYAPYPRALVQVSSGEMVVAAFRADEQGYFVALLPAGNYRITSGIATATITIATSSTFLIPLRAGKRMVD